MSYLFSPREEIKCINCMEYIQTLDIEEKKKLITLAELYFKNNKDDVDTELKKILIINIYNDNPVLIWYLYNHYTDYNIKNYNKSINDLLYIKVRNHLAYTIDVDSDYFIKKAKVPYDEFDDTEISKIIDTKKIFYVKYNSHIESTESMIDSIRDNIIECFSSSYTFALLYIGFLKSSSCSIELLDLKSITNMSKIEPSNEDYENELISTINSLKLELEEVKK